MGNLEVALRKNGSIWVIGGMQCIYTIGGIMQKLGFWFINDVIWRKKNPTPNFKGTRLNNSHETLIWATKDEKSKYTFNYKTAKEINTDKPDKKDFDKGVRKQLGSVWEIGICQGSERIKNKDGKKLHSTQKPEELLYRIIVVSSKQGDIVLDPFGGTMTTAVVAKKTGRKYIMIEKEKEYCDYGKQRVDDTQVEIGDIEKAVFDVKPPKVDVKDMIKHNYLIENEIFYLRDKKPRAKLLSNAKLEYENMILDMHTCAAVAEGKKAARVNGFDSWYVNRDGTFVNIGVIREQYRKERF
jgi:site-specific DNA-methyltransferase (adenine-specific)